MKNNIDDLGDKVRKACDDLEAAGGVSKCSDEDWQTFGAAIDEEVARSRAYQDEMRDIMKMIDPNSRQQSKQDSD